MAIEIETAINQTPKIQLPTEINTDTRGQDEYVQYSSPVQQSSIPTFDITGSDINPISSNPFPSALFTSDAYPTSNVEFEMCAPNGDGNQYVESAEAPESITRAPEGVI